MQNVPSLNKENNKKTFPRCFRVRASLYIFRFGLFKNVAHVQSLTLPE